MMSLIGSRFRPKTKDQRLKTVPGLRRNKEVASRSRSEGKVFGLRSSVFGPKCGFTLIEVMVAVAVLALGAVFIFEAFFQSLDIVSFSEHYLAIAPWANEQIWQAQHSLAEFGSLHIPGQGQLTSRNKHFTWTLSYNMIGSNKLHNLYRIDLQVSWKEGKRSRRIYRTACALHALEQS